MANTEIFLRNIFGTTRPNIRPLVLALNITNDLLFEQHISMSDIKATKHIYPDVICTPFTGHPVEGVLLCGTHMSTKGNV